MMDFVPPVQRVRQNDGRRGVDDGGADDVWHISMIAVLGDSPFLLGEELAHGGEVDVAAEDGDADALLRGEFLQFLHEPVPLRFVVSGRPVVVEIVEDFHPPVEFIDEPAEHSHAAEGFDGVLDAAGEDVFEKVETGVGDGDAEEDEEVFGLPLDDLPTTTIEDEVVRLLGEDLIAHPLGSAIETQ